MVQIVRKVINLVMVIIARLEIVHIPNYQHKMMILVRGMMNHQTLLQQNQQRQKQKNIHHLGNNLHQQKTIQIQQLMILTVSM